MLVVVTYPDGQLQAEIYLVPVHKEQWRDVHENSPNRSRCHVLVKHALGVAGRFGKLAEVGDLFDAVWSEVV